MNTISVGTKPSTKRLRFSLLKAFFNYIQDSIEPNFKNPCNSQALRKLFRASKPAQIKILEKDVVDEIIFRTPKPRNRLLLELMARSGMRVGEVLKLTPNDVDGRKLTIQDPKSGTETEVAFLPQKVADRLRDYIHEKDIQPHDQIFSISFPQIQNDLHARYDYHIISTGPESKQLIPLRAKEEHHEAFKIRTVVCDLSENERQKKIRSKIMNSFYVNYDIISGI